MVLTLIYTIYIVLERFQMFFLNNLLTEWIDNGNYKKALHELDKLIKKLPSQNCSKVCSQCLDYLYNQIDCWNKIITNFGV